MPENECGVDGGGNCEKINYSISFRNIGSHGILLLRVLRTYVAAEYIVFRERGTNTCARLMAFLEYRVGGCDEERRETWSWRDVYII
jgi:hypothetical protein